MRVMLVLEACGGGAGRHVVDLAEGLLTCGHDVSLVYSPLRADAWFLDEIVSVRRLDTHPLPMGRSVTIGDLAMSRALRSLIDTAGPFDVLHGHSSKAGALLRLAQLNRKTPVVYTPHAPITMDPELPAPARTVYLIVERLLAGLCNTIICVSPAERDHLKHLGFPERKLQVVCNGIAPLPEFDRNAIRSGLNLEPETICFGFVGRISHQKAVDRAISAFATVHQRIKNSRLIIVGDGPELDAMKKLAVEQSVSDQVLFTGSANGVELMAGFDVFLLPSRYEGMPYVLLEAAASGLPIIMTDVGGAHLVVRNEENGFIIPQGQTELLADRLLAIATQPELLRKMSMQSREISATFSLDNMVKGTIAVYERLLSGQKN